MSAQPYYPSLSVGRLPTVEMPRAEYDATRIALIRLNLTWADVARRAAAEIRERVHGTAPVLSLEKSS